MKIDLNNLTFMRFGSLSPVKQEGYKAVSDSFHQPPARHGIYAFVEGQKEKFLLGKHCFNQKMHIIVPKEESEHVIWRSEKVANYFEENFESWSDEECEKHREENEVAVNYGYRYSKDHLEVFIEKVK